VMPLARAIFVVRYADLAMALFEVFWNMQLLDVLHHEPQPPTDPSVVLVDPAPGGGEWIRAAVCPFGTGSSEWIYRALNTPNLTLLDGLECSGSVWPNFFAKHDPCTIFLRGVPLPDNVTPNSIIGRELWKSASGNAQPWPAGTVQPENRPGRSVTYPLQDPTLDPGWKPDPDTFQEIIPQLRPMVPEAVMRQPGLRPQQMATVRAAMRDWPEFEGPFAYTPPSVDPRTRTPGPGIRRPPPPGSWPSNRVQVDPRPQPRTRTLMQFEGGYHRFTRYRGGRMKKLRMPVFWALRAIINLATETADAIRELWKALPADRRRGHPRKVTSMVQDLWRNWGRIDWREAIFNLLANNAEDLLIGKSNRAINRASIASGPGLATTFGNIFDPGHRYGSSEHATDRMNPFEWFNNLADAVKWRDQYERDPRDLRALRNRLGREGFFGQAFETDVRQRDIIRAQRREDRRAWRRNQTGRDLRPLRPAGPQWR